MELIQKLMARQELDWGQLQTYEAYAADPNFQEILSAYFYYEIPHVLDFYRLKALEVGDLTPVFAETLQQWEATQKAAEDIKNSFTKKDHPYQQLTTATDLETIVQLCRQLTRRERDADAVLVTFFNFLAEAHQNIQEQKLADGHTLAETIESMPADWYQEPWYYIYVQYFGTDEAGKGSFDQLIKMLDYLDALGIKNIYMLPHYETPGGDAGYDISAYEPAKTFGGKAAFQRFMDQALARGFRVATDLVFNHCSVEHDWFQQALAGSSHYYDYFLKCPSSWGQLPIEDMLRDEEGDLYLYLPEKDAQGNSVISKRILIFPDVDQTLWLSQKVEKLQKEVLFYREFYPFQVDMDIQQPQVVRELFKFLAEEMAMGIVGKRTDAIAHWVKAPGTTAKNLPPTYALQKLIKQFLKHINPKAIILPEVVTTSKELKEYAGEATYINGHRTTTGGDALLDFQMQGMLREMLYFQKTTPFWTQVFDLGPVGQNTSVALIPIEHHDETYMGFIQEIEAMRAYLSGNYIYLDDQHQYQEAPRGIIYKNGMSAGARYADALNRDHRRIANAFFCLYLMPGTPVIYYGTEIGAPNQWPQMDERQKEQYQTLLHLLGSDRVGPGKAVTFEQCKDPRELQRGTIPARSFYEALDQNYPAAEIIQKLNILRKQHTALRSLHIAPVDTYDERLLAMLRFPEGPEGNGNFPFLALSNLSEQDLTAKIPFVQLQNHLSCGSIELVERLRLDGIHPRAAKVSNQPYSFNPGQPELLEIALPAYSALLFEVHPIR